MVHLESNAYFSRDRRHRYWLSRTLTLNPGVVAFVGLNPSTADEHTDDPTVRRCIGFAMAWGYGRMLMLNLHAFRSTDPKGLYTADDPVGPENASLVLTLANAADNVICAWGANALHRDAAVIAERLAAIPGVGCFGLTKGGHPKHPLYLPANNPVFPWPGVKDLATFGRPLPPAVVVP
jgi:hypothetical protein